jgi:RNA polymerase sigma factor (sigma-70 family)
MVDSIPNASPCADAQLVIQAQHYLSQREQGLSPGPDLEAAWKSFYDLYARKIRVYALTCGTADEDLVDCVQEVWRELLVRLPRFQLDPCRGQFATWLFAIVQGKAADQRRSRKRRLVQGTADILETVTDHRPSPVRALEEGEMVGLAWGQLRNRLSECNYQVLQLRLVEQRPVAEVAERLGLSHEQVWYRYHRARRELEEIGSALARGQHAPHSVDDATQGKRTPDQKSAQGTVASSVSRNGTPSCHGGGGGNCVDYVFQKLELGRRELNPEWKVEWNCDGLPKPMLYIRKMAVVAYAEICGCGDFITANWPRIANAAITAGVAAGIATIVATPSAALPIFQTEFHKQLQGKGGSAVDERIQVALSARPEANGPWCVCKD